MVQRVHQGQKIQAAQFNSLADAVGGLEIPARHFLKTQEGPVATFSSTLEADADQQALPFLKAAVGPALHFAESSLTPFDGWTPYSEAQLVPPPKKHLYFYFGADDLNNETSTLPYKQPNLQWNGIPAVFSAWSMLGNKHIVTDKDLLANNAAADFDNFNSLRDGVDMNAYHGWIETPFEPAPGTKVYGAFYKLFDVTDSSLAGGIFILTMDGTTTVGEQTEEVYPIHCFSQPFLGPNGHSYVVGEQCSRPVLICEVQEKTQVPGLPSTYGAASSKLVQCHTGPVHCSQPPAAQLAWSVLCFAEGNEDGENYDIDCFAEMKITDADHDVFEELAPYEVISADGKAYVSIKNLQVSGKQALVEIDSGNPVVEGVLSKEDIEGKDLPFINIYREPTGWIDGELQWANVAYLVFPEAIVQLPASSTQYGLAVMPTQVQAAYVWLGGDLKTWVVVFMEGGRIDRAGALVSDSLACEIRFDGTGAFTWHVPQEAVFQGTFANNFRDIPATDYDLGTGRVPGSADRPLTGNASISYANWLSSVGPDGTPIHVPTETYTALSANHPLGLQLYKFDQMNYLSSFNEALSNQTLLSSLDLVVRHRHYDGNAGSRIEYYNLSSILSGSALPCDTEATAGLQNKYRSLDTMLSGDGSPYYELHDFHEISEPGYGTRVKFEDAQHEEDFSIAGGTQFVVRKPNGAGGYDIKYQTLSVVQEHERVDSSGAAIQTISRSLQYETYPGIGTNYDVMELYQFSNGCTTSLTSADISADPGNGVLVRIKDGTPYNLQYMDFKSIDNFTKKYVGDSQLDQQPLTPVDKSANVYWSNNDQKYAVELYNFKTGADTAYVNIRTDGNTYWWPQDVKTTSQMNEWDYVLVKHLDSQGNQELQYKQLAVTMPDLSGLGDGLSAISAVVYEHSVEITTISAEVIELSGKISADYWEQGGDNTTCYGSSIGDSTQTEVVDLDNKTLVGNWAADTQLDIGCTWFNASTGDGYVAGTFEVEGCLLANSDVRCGSIVYANRGLTIGNTSINEAQLSALLQLVNAPQQLRQL